MHSIREGVAYPNQLLLQHIAKSQKQQKGEKPEIHLEGEDEILFNIEINLNNTATTFEEKCTGIDNGQKEEEEEYEEEADEEEEENDLTNLAWLTELRKNQTCKYSYWENDGINCDLDDLTTAENSSLIQPNSTSFHLDENTQTTTSSKNTTKTTTNFNENMPKLIQQNQKQQPNKLSPNLTVKRPTPVERFEIFCKKVKRDLFEYDAHAMEYQNKEEDKPPFNYSHIIGMVMMDKGRVTLQQICQWIEMKFAYFRARKKWNVST